MKVLVTGASGFLGRNLLQALPIDWPFRALNGRAACDLADATVHNVRVAGTTDVQELAKEGPWDVVFHLAARVDVAASLLAPDLDARDNAFATLNVCRYVRCKHLIYLSTGAVYEGQYGVADQTKALAPSVPYAIHKLVGEHYARAAVHRWHTAERATIVRFFGAYGPWEPTHKLIYRLVRSFGVEGKTAFGLVGDGNNYIDAMWAPDAAAALVRIARDTVSRPDVWTVDLAGGEPMLVTDFAILVSRLLAGREPELSYFGEASEAHRFAADVMPFRAALDWWPAMPLRQGLVAYRDLMLANAKEPAKGMAGDA